MSDFDADIRRRQAQLAALETPRAANVVESSIYAEDDLDRADRIAGAGPQSGGQGAGLDQKVSLRANKWNELVKSAHFVRTNPPSVLNGILGNQATVGLGEQKQVVNWGGEDSETLPCTITCAPVSDPQPVGANATFRPFAKIRFGTKGFLVNAEVDIGRGMQLTVSGSSVTVMVALPPSLQIPPYELPPTMQIAGMLSFYPIVRTVPITRTLYIDTPIGQGSTALFIPPFSKQLRLAKQVIGVGATINILDSSGNSTLGTYLVPAGTQMTSPILLPNGAEIITLSDTATPANSVAGTLIFELAL
jgi:hypothetical protein